MYLAIKAVFHGGGMKATKAFDEAARARKSRSVLEDISQISEW